MFWKYLKWNILLCDLCFVNNLKFKGKGIKLKHFVKLKVQSFSVCILVYFAFLFCLSPLLMYVQNNLILTLVQVLG